MERIATLAKLVVWLWSLLLGLYLLLLQLHGAQGRWVGSTQGELPPCSQVPGGIPGWDCYDPPTHPLPPCDFKHQRIGFDCSGWPPASRSESQGAGRHVQGELLLPCRQVPGGIPGWDCYDPPTPGLPPCNFEHQRIGFACWPAAPH